MPEQPRFKLDQFRNLDGEGVCARIDAIGTGTEHEVLCGNEKLMERFNINLEFNNFRMNMQSLEREGKTVVCMVIDQVPRLLISLEESHLTKPEALAVVTYLRDVMNMKVAMITGDNKHTAQKVA